MAYIDVSELLDDPDFVSTIVLERGKKSVGLDGLASRQVYQKASILAALAPAGAKMTRRDGSQVSSGAQRVYTRFPLTSGAGSLDADMLIINGVRYTVTDANLWTQGAQFTEAVAELYPLDASQTG